MNENKEPIVFRQAASKTAVLLFASFPLLLGLLSLYSFFNRINYLGPDEWFLFFFGTALLWLTYLFLRFIFLPSFIIDNREMVIRKFFSVRKFRYVDIDSIQAYTLWIRPRNARGRLMNVDKLETKQLLIKTRDGKTRQATLPGYGPNTKLLTELSERSGLRIEELPDQTK